MSVGHRVLVVLRGTREDTLSAARRAVAPLDPTEVLWVGGDHPGAVAPRSVADLLGRAFDAVVLDAHGGVDADVLGQCHGFVRGGGGLVLRLAPVAEPPAPSAELAAFPYDRCEVGRRFQARFERCLARAPLTSGPLAPPRHVLTGTDEQHAVSGALTSLFLSDGAGCVAVLADRGRGKSAALGLALARALTSNPALRVAVTAAREDAVGEIRRFCPRAPFVPLMDLVHAEADAFDVIVVDEAAQVPVPVLRALIHRFGAARFAFATTVRGYEGTGRGYALRFLPWLEERRPVERLTLSAPIRWSSNDPLERFVFDALLLDAEPAPVEAVARETIAAEALDRDALGENERDLGALFGLLVHAHYRTTPGDMQRLLDAPNLAVHVLRSGGAIVAACIIAREGGLTPTMCDELFAGRRRIRAHALADALVAHLGERDAGRLTMIRSVRIAVHPALRRQGLARSLVEHVHERYRPDLFGTLFGATAELITFRREVGYEVVRVSASRGTRTGEPSVMMLRPVSEPARALCSRLRAQLARDLDVQLELLADDLLLEPALVAALHAGLPAPLDMSDADCDALVRAYCEGPRTLESIAPAAQRFVARHARALASLPAPERTVIEGRVLAGASWAAVARAAGLADAGVAMRLMRRALRALAQRIDRKDL